PTSANVSLDAKATGLPSTLPRVFRPTTAAAAPNGQRLVLPAQQTVAGGVDAIATRSRISVSTVAVPTALAAGEQVRDRRTISGGTAAWKAPVGVAVYGPFASAGAYHCDGTPAWKGSFSATGNGTFTTPPATLAKAGWYTFVETIPGDAANVGLT